MAKKEITLKKKHPGGRPTLYNQDLAKRICRAIASSTKSIKRICAENSEFPDASTIFEWRLEHPEFSSQYAQAKADQIEALTDECLEIADEISLDTITKHNKDGSEYDTCNTEWINRSRLRVDTRKWLASKLAPKIWGDKKLEEDDKTQETLREAVSMMKELASKCLKPA